MARPKKVKPVVKPDNVDEKVIDQPRVDENGVKIEKNVFPPADADSFNGTSVANRQYRNAVETSKENEKK